MATADGADVRGVVRDDEAARSTRELEAEITELAGHLQAANRRWVAASRCIRAHRATAGRPATGRGWPRSMPRRASASMRVRR